MNIAHVIGPLIVHGGNRSCLEHAWFLGRSGHSVTVFAVEGADAGWYENPLDIRYFPRRGIAEVLQPGEFDLVVANHHEGATECLSLRHPAKVYAYRNYDPFLVAPAIRRKAFELYDRYPHHMANSNVIAELVSLHSPARIHVVPSGLDYRLFEKLRESRTRQQTGRPRVGVMVAYPNRVKGLDLISAVFRELKERSPGVETVGIFQIAVDIPSVDRMVVAPTLEQKLAEIHDLDVFLHTSSFESLPRAPLEAMALGVPVVATNSWGILEISNSDNLVMVERRSPPYIAGTVLDLLGDADRRARLRDAGIATARARDWALAAAELEASYEDIISSIRSDARSAPETPRRATILPETRRDLDRLANIYMSLERVKQGLGIFSRLARIQGDPDQADAFRQLARLRLAAERPWPYVLAPLLESFERDPENPHTRRLMIRLLRGKNWTKLARLLEGKDSG